MYTRNQARHWEQPQLHGVAAVQQAEAGLPWEQEQGHNSAEQETWLLSFIDVLTLLLTLFVLLLAYQKSAGDHDGGAGVRMPARLVQAVAQIVTPNIPPPATADEVRPLPESPVPGLDLVPQRTATLHPEATSDQAASVPGSDADRQDIVPAVVAPDVAAGLPLFDQQAAPPVTTAEPHYLLQLDAATADDAVRELAQLAQAVQTDSPSDPVEQLLSDLQHSSLRGRVEVSVQPDAVNLEISDNILFSPASAALTEGGRGLLDDLAATLKDLPYALSVEGHTDNVPIQTALYPSNWELSAARATMVTRHLVESGVAAGRIRAIGYADTRPRADNGSVEGRARNRRVAFVLRMPTQ